MESNPSLIEIAGEDDSLLHEIPTLDDTTTATNYYFTCSPLQVLGSSRNADRTRVSPIMGLKDNLDVEKPTCSSSVGSSNKENINADKSVVPKLSVEPQQMKRRKRGGAYNLRKSLAWDRAFFTEEGVLNPLELSILSGSFGNCSREMLPTIHEEGRKFSSNSCGTSDSADLQQHGENLVKEIPMPSSNKRENTGSLLMKHVTLARDNSVPTSVGTPKILSNRKGNRTGSKSGCCPRPSVFPSLKRPANASTTKATMKESKVPKIPVSRSGAHSLPNSIMSNVLSTSHSKHNQIGQADIFQNSAGLQGSIKNSKSSANKSKACSDPLSKMTAKSSVQHPRRNMANLALEVHSSTNPHSTLVTKGNCGLEVFPAAVVRPPTGPHAPDAHDVSRKTGILLPQDTHCINGNTRYTQFQTTKPSGLRMPSPSLGFFGQSKSSASNSSFQKATQPSKIPEPCIPSLRRLNATNSTPDPRRLHAPAKMPKMDNNATVSGNAGVSGSSTECSVPCVGNDVSHENRKLLLEGNNLLMVEEMTPCYSKRSEPRENQEVHNIVDGDEVFQECGEPHKIYQSSSKEDSDVQMDDNNGLLQMESSHQLKKDSNNEVNIIGPDYRDSNMNDLENTNFTSQHSCAELVKGVPGTNDAIKDQHVKDKQCSSSVGSHDIIFESESENETGDIKQGFVIIHNDNSSDIHDVDERFKKEAELINASSGEAYQICERENHKLMSNDGILLEDRKLFECQKYNSENSNRCESNGSEKLSLNSPPSESTEQPYECAAGVDQFSGNLHVEDVQVHFLDATLLAKSCDNKLHTSEIHDQYLVVDDDNIKFGEPPKPQSCCLLVEQSSQLNTRFLLDDDYSLLSEGTPAEESQGVYGLGVALNVILEKGNDCRSKLNCSNVFMIQDQGAIQEGDADAYEMVGQQQVKVALSSSAEGVPLVKIHKCYVDTHFRHDLSMQKSGDHMDGDVTTCKSIAFCSLSKEEDMGANGLKNDILAEKAETKVSSDNVHEENERIKMNGGILVGESISFDEFDTGDLGNTVDVSLINQGSYGSEFKSCQVASLFEYTERANEGAAGIEKMADELFAGDAKVQSLDGNPLVASSNSRMSNSAMDSQCLMVVNDLNGQSGRLPEMQASSVVVDHVFHDNHGLHLNDYLLLGKSTSSDELQEEKVFANVPFICEQNDVDGSESKSPIVVIQEPLSLQDSCVDVEFMAEHQLVDDAPSSSVYADTSTEHHKSSIDTSFGNAMVFSGQETSTESDSALVMMNDQTFGVITTYNAFCLGEESGFSVQKVQTLADETNVVSLGADTINTILPDDTEIGISQTDISPTGELQHKLDNAICLEEDEDTAVPIKKGEDGGNQNNLMIRPPINSVPFSDEWLAAMEAAGEEILAMKSGPVQNSPPDKSLTEPGPWSPVKRKQNEIGPFDCTKFTNIPPQDSD